MTSSHEKPQDKRAELIRRLTQLTPKGRLDAMLEDVDGKSLVRSLPAEDVYRTIIEVGLVDSTEVVQLSTASQFRTYVDLAAWQRDRVDPLEVLHWLRAARGEDDEDFLRKLQGLDIEVLELVFKKLFAVHDLEEDPDVDTAGPTIETPEGKYLLEAKVEGADEAALRRLVYDLTTHNPFELGRFIEAVRWELETELEETAYQFRQARLQDLGFPPMEEAVKVFAWRDPDKVEVVRAGEALVTGQGHVDFVGGAFEGLDAVERKNLEAEVRYLVNCVLLAEGAEPGDPPAIRRYSERARDSLDLGLEHLTGGDRAQASEVVRRVPLREIFQLGFSLTLKLKRQAERLAAESGTRFGETFVLLDEEGQALAALLRRRPLKALKVPGAEAVPFRSKRELAEAVALMKRARGQREVLNALLGASPAEVVSRFGLPLAELTPQRFFAAVVARAEIDAVVDPAPFPELRLQELCARIFDEGLVLRLRDSAGQRALETLQARVEDEAGELKGMIARVLTAMLNDFGPAWFKSLRVRAEQVHALPITGQLPL